jgi:hypothetical protein
MVVMAKALIPLGTDRATLNSHNAPSGLVKYKCKDNGSTIGVSLIGPWNADMDASIKGVVDFHNGRSAYYGNQIGGGEKSEYHREEAGRINTAYESTKCSYAMKDMSVEGITAQIRTDCQTLNQSNGERLVNFEQKSASECRKWYNVQNYPHDDHLPSRISVAYSLLPRATEREQQQQKGDEERKQSELAASRDPQNPCFGFFWESEEQRDDYRRKQHETDEKVADQMRKEVARDREKVMAERSAILMAEQGTQLG